MRAKTARREDGGVLLSLLSHRAALAGLLALALAACAWAVVVLAKPISEHDVAESDVMAAVAELGSSIRDDIARAVRPAIQRTQMLATEAETVRALVEGTAEARTDVCNRAVTKSTEIDAFALFDAAGQLVGINEVYATGEPIEPSRVERVLQQDLSDRQIVQSCLINDSNLEVLEFQTNCDITPAFFDSTGLSVAYSVPVRDPRSGAKIGVASARLRFERLTELIRRRTVAQGRGVAEFVTDTGEYFSEEINSGHKAAPVPTPQLAPIIGPVIQGGMDFMLARHDGFFVSVFPLREFTTIDGGGIQVVLLTDQDWLLSAARLNRRLQAAALCAGAVAAILLACALRNVAKLRASERRATAALAQAATALAERAAYQQALDEHAIVAITDSAGCIVEVNDAFCRVSKFTREESIGQAFRLHAFAQSENCWREIERTISDGRVWHGELRNRAKDGTTYWVDATIAPFRDAAGRIVKRIHVLADVSKRKSAERTLADDRAQLAAFVEHAPAAIAMLDRDMKYIAASNRWLSDFGLTSEQVIGRSHYDLYPEMPDRWKDAHRRGLAGEAVRNEHDMWHPPGHDREQHLRWEVRPWYVAGEAPGDARRIGGIMLFAEDLTETIELQARAAEVAERLEMALDSGGLGCWDWDVQSDYVHFDERFGNQLGLSRDELHVRAEQWLARLHPDDAPLAQRAVRDHLAGRAPTYENEHRVRHADGSWRWILDRGRVVERAADGTPLRMVGTHTDITQRKDAEAQLSQAQRLESIGQLAAGIAHEINTPTQYVSDNVRFLRDQFDNVLAVVTHYSKLLDPGTPQMTWRERVAEARSMLEQLDFEFLRTEIPQAIAQSLEGIERVASIVRAMKDFSHPGSEEKQPADLNKAIESTITVCRNRWKYVADMKLDLASDLPMMPCHVAEFNQVILNLVVNAADAISEANAAKGVAKGAISVSTALVGACVEIRVSDTGCGIPDALKHRIFDPFFTTKQVGKGTGQGLTISRNVIVDKHGGTIECESKVGEGSTFIVRLPVVERASGNRSRQLTREAA